MKKNRRRSYATAKQKIIDGIMPMAYTSLEEFHHRKLWPGEALTVFVYNLKALLERAMPGLAAEAREQLLLHQFLAGIPSSVSRQLRASGDTANLNNTIAKARLLMAVNDQQEVAAVGVAQKSEITQLQGKIEVLTQQVATLAAKQRDDPSAPVQRCYYCNQSGHVQHECPCRRPPAYTRRCWTCGQVGHLSRNCWQGNDAGMPGKGNKHPGTQY